MASYEVRIVERDGTLVRTLGKTNVAELVREKNTHPQARWTFPKHDPADHVGQGADVQPLKREVQLWRNGETLRHWGVILDPSGSSDNGAVTIESPGVSWHLSRLFVEEPRTNFLDNPGFETGDLTGWTEQGGVDATVIASPRRLGSWAVRLENDTTGADAFIDQTQTFSGGDIGLAVFFAGHYMIESWSGPALESRGLYIEGAELGVLREVQFTELDDVDGTEVGIWHKTVTGIWVPPAETWALNPRPYAPHGSIVWDALQLVTMESTGLFDGDLGDLAAMVLNFVQDPANGKADLSIAVDTPTTGVTIPVKFWQHADAIPAEKAIDELVERDDGIDWSVVLDGTVEPATKTWTAWFPNIGTDRTTGPGEVTLAFGVNIAHYDYVEVVSEVETDVAVQAPEGSGPDREEGRATDTTEFDGLVLQGIHPAPPGAQVDELLPRAQYILDQTKIPPKVVELVTYEGAGELIELLDIGDRVNVVIDDGFFQVDGPYEIVRIVEIPRTDTLKLTMNVVSRGKRFPYSVDRHMAKMASRLEDLERRKDTPGRARSVEVLRFSQSGIAALAESGEDVAELGGQVASVTLTALAAGAGTTTVQIYVNGVAVGSTVSLAAADTLKRAYIGNIRVAAHSDKVRAKITAAGGHDSVTVLVRLRS